MTSCFTKGYGRYIKGTGSVLYIGERDTERTIQDGNNNAKVDEGTDSLPMDGVGDSKSIHSDECCNNKIENIDQELCQEDANDCNKRKRKESKDMLEVQASASQLPYTMTPPPINLKTCILRYFTPKELLHIFGFMHETFVFPSTISNRKKYELIGNSLNVTIAAYLLDHLFQCTSLADIHDSK